MIMFMAFIGSWRTLYHQSCTNPFLFCVKIIFCHYYKNRHVERTLSLPQMKIVTGCWGDKFGSDQRPPHQTIMINPVFMAAVGIPTTISYIGLCKGERKGWVFMFIRCALHSSYQDKHTTIPHFLTCGPDRWRWLTSWAMRRQNITIHQHYEHCYR